MSHPAADLFLSGLDFFEDAAAPLSATDWDQPSPCEGWTALDVLGHLTSAMEMGISLLHGEQPTWPTFDRPADLVEGPPIEVFRSIADRARPAVEGADLDLVMDTPMGPRTVADRLAFPAIDLYVHAWDVAASVGRSVALPDALIEFAHTYLDPFPDDMMRGPNGALGPEVTAPVDATPTEAFIAWTGRSPRR